MTYLNDRNKQNASLSASLTLKVSKLKFESEVKIVSHL